MQLRFYKTHDQYTTNTLQMNAPTDRERWLMTPQTINA
jgi:predicted metalloendopeptidase